MHTAEARQFYQSGFPKEMQRGKYNLALNDRLKSARNAKGLSSAQVVAKLKRRGVTIGHSTLQGYEANENSVNHRYPSLPVLLTLSHFYDCSLDYLFGISDEMKRPPYDIFNLLSNQKQVLWDGKRISRKQRDEIIAEIEKILAE